MKRFMLIFGIILFFSSNANAQSFNWGYETYSQAGTALVVNSNGDQPTLSTFGNLGTNDFNGELGVKNDLALQGYTQAYDYNPQNTNPSLSNYNQSLPSGVALTKLTFSGFEGNPRATQDVYVLTSEYNALSAQGQANSITNLNTITTNQGNLINGLQTSVDQNTTSILNETNRATGAEGTLQNNINSVDSNSVGRDNQLQNGINSANDRINSDEKKIRQLEKPQGMVNFKVRLYDSKKIEINTFINTSVTRRNVAETGVEVVYKLGESYQDKALAKIQSRLDKLEGVQEVKERQSNSEVYATENGGLGIRNKF